MRILPLFIFWCLWYLNFSTRTIFSPILPLIEDSLLLSHGKAGGLFISLSVGYSLALLATGRLTLAWGYRRTVAIGFLGVSLVFFGFQFAESYVSFHLLFFLLGIATGTYIPSILPIITETYESRNWGKAIGLHDSAASFSIFSIPILMAYGLQFFSYKTPLLLLGIVSLIFPLFFWKVSAEPKKEPLQEGESYTGLFKKRTIWIMILFWILSSASSMGVYSILPLYLIKERGIDFELANQLLGISRAGGMAVPILIGFLVDRYGYRTILFLSLLMTGLSTIALSLSSPLSLIFISLTLQAVLSLGFFPVALATISKLAPLSSRSMVLGVIMSVGVGFGMGVTPFLLGLTADHFNFRVGIFWLGVLTSLSSLSVHLLKEERTG
ncbi:MAG: MFS transporter [Thermodesulfobacteriota bacterium]|nr:MFS transporter [Thermodesulfobacteriota bacterium]